MVNLYRRCSVFISACWAIITALSFDVNPLERVLTTLRRVVECAFKAATGHTLPQKAEWKIVERMCSESVREQVNIFGRRPRNTGALCSPLL